MNVSYLIITYNRRDALLANVRALFANDADAALWVVDNGSIDGTADALRAAFPRVRLLQLDRNVGMPARNVALRQMRSEFVVLLDDDSHPLGDAVASSVAHMRTHSDVAAVTGSVVLRDGRVEAPAMPSVLLGGASCVRLRALRDVGFFPHDFFRQAEEYDLSARLWNAGHRVERFEDVVYRHDKSAAPGRASREVARLDLRHNLIVAARHLPAAFASVYAEDFAARYHAIMTSHGFGDDFDAAIHDARRYIANPASLARQPMGDDAFESMFAHGDQLRRVSRWATKVRVRRVAIADVSKNLYATYQACRRNGLQIVGIVDERPAFLGSTYRGVPVLAPADVVGHVDGVVISNTNPAQVDAIDAEASLRIDRPTLRLWTPKRRIAEDEPIRLAA